MTGSDLAKMYEFSYGAVNRNVEGVTEEESLVKPQLAGNCLNWVLGHIVVYRGTHPDAGRRGSRFAARRRRFPIAEEAHPSDSDTLLDMATLARVLCRFAAAADSGAGRALGRSTREPGARPA